MYVAIEGIDGCGKSTQVALLKEKYPGAIITKEPGGTKLGEKLREILLFENISKKAELMLFLADRAEHFSKVIKPNLNKLVISDRSFLSGIAYAMINKEFDINFLIKLNRFVLEDTLPQKLILFEITKKELIKRLSAKEQDSIEQRGIEYLMQIQKNLFEIATSLKLDFLKIDASKDINTIHKQIVSYLKV